MSIQSDIHIFQHVYFLLDPVSTGFPAHAGSDSGLQCGIIPLPSEAINDACDQVEAAVTM